MSRNGDAENGTTYRLSRAVAEAFPGRGIVEGLSSTLREQMKSEMAAPAKPVTPKFDDFFP